jgi:hypothetical protein
VSEHPDGHETPEEFSAPKMAQEAGAGLPRATPLPIISTDARDRGGGRTPERPAPPRPWQDDRDRFQRSLDRLHSVDPSFVAAPLARRKRLALRTCGIAAGMLLVAAATLVIVGKFSTAIPGLIPGAIERDVAALKSGPAVPAPSPSALSDEPLPPAPQLFVTQTASGRTDEPLRLGASVSGAADGKLERTPDAAGLPASRVDPQIVTALLARGEDLMASGDPAAARLALQFAAEAGDARATMALAATYDPIVLEKLGIPGRAADINKARAWYQKARESGAAEAPRRLELLASRAR